MSVVDGAPGQPMAIPGIWRRLASGLYEGVLLFGVVMLVGFAYGLATQQRHALQGVHGLQVVLFLALGVYFAWFWAHGGQTVAMKTWQIRVVGPDGQPPAVGRAALRYVASWLWFAPGLLALAWADAHDGGTIAAALGANVAVYALLARLHPSRQFLHDLLCGTRLERWRPALR